MSRRVTVVGGGIAGLVAAIEAATAGADVRLLEERAELGGRARTAAPPFRANLGPHALYSDGAFWRWLAKRDLLPSCVDRDAGLVYRVQGDLRDSVPGIREAIGALLASEAPSDRSFSSWATALVGAKSAADVAALCFIVTYDHEPGRLSAAFVQERLRRLVSPGVVRYVVGGWQALVATLAACAERLGVVIETRHRVSQLPEPPVVVAVPLAAARRLLRSESLRWEGTRVGLLDLAVPRTTEFPTSLLDLDERLYLARYTAFDATLAPPGLELIQVACGCRPGERLSEVELRMTRVLDGVAPAWRETRCWLRRSLLTDSTGALDLPGRQWSERPPIDVAPGVYLAGDAVAAPGLLSEVAFESARSAGAFAAETSIRRDPPVVSAAPVEHATIPGTRR
jgi:hypothetical protein